MNPPFPTTARGLHPRAFTLVELLVVLAIIAIIATLIIPAIGPLLISYNLNRAASMTTDELTFARQSALTRNADVEVRFYKTGSNANAGDLQFRAFRCFLSATNQPLDKISYLPGQVIMSANTTTFSTLLNFTSTTPVSPSTAILPGTNTACIYYSFLFRATGGTNLTPVTSLWFLTLYSETSPVTGTGLPSNYVGIQIDPVTGSVRVYRP
jgi:uncharacterized protein (TIGR02596 family)